jgi:hypothetical protein
MMLETVLHAYTGQLSNTVQNIHMWFANSNGTIILLSYLIISLRLLHDHMYAQYHKHSIYLSCGLLFQLACDTAEPCVKHYLDRAASHTVGYKFICSCPESYYCPTSRNKIHAYDTDGSDEAIGPYVLGYCEPVLGWDRQHWNNWWKWSCGIVDWLETHVRVHMYYMMVLFCKVKSKLRSMWCQNHSFYVDMFYAVLYTSEIVSSIQIAIRYCAVCNYMLFLYWKIHSIKMCSNSFSRQCINI